MNFLEATNAVLRACSEAEVASVATSPPGSVAAKFGAFVNEAYRLANTRKRWPWTKAILPVTAGATADTFIVDPSLLEIIAVTYAGVRLSDRYTFEELLVIPSFGVQTGMPAYFAMQDFNTIRVYPKPTDTAPETLVQVYGYTSLPDLVNDTDVLAGPAEYHDAVVQLAYAIAKDKHFGDENGAKEAWWRADALLRAVYSKARRNKAAPRIRV